MTNKNRIDLVDSLKRMQRILANRPEYKEMLEEVRMMRFKIRPIVGNITEINLKDLHLVETLWSLGKLEEFFDRDYDRLPLKQRNSFLRIFDSIKDRLQNNLNKVNIRQSDFKSTSPLIEMEIVKELPLKRQIN